MSGARKMVKFRKEQNIKPGSFFIMNGIMLYVDKVGEKKEDNTKKSRV